MNNKSVICSLALVAFLLVPSVVFALGFEVAVGGWGQSPDGSVGYRPLSGTDEIDLENDAKYDDELQAQARLKIDMPLIIPNVYLMYTPMAFEGTGRKITTFKFGDQTFDANVDFYSKVVMDHYDVALFWGVPLLETVSADTLNVELGINVRMVEFSAEVRQDASGFYESTSETLAVPMVFVGVQIRPVDAFAIEVEGRGISYSDNAYYDLIGRLKYHPFGPLFITAGWRYENLEIDEKDIKAELTVSGPFAEVGFDF